MELVHSLPAPRFASLTAWLGGSDRSRGVRGYLNAIAAVLATVLVRVLLEVVFAERAPTYFVFLAPVFAASIIGGVGPGMFATLLAWGTAHFFFVGPTFEFKTTSQDWVTAGVFLAEGAAIALIGGRLRGTFRQLVEREEQLAASEGRLLAAQSAARIATYEWVPSSDTVTWSENAAAIMGLAPAMFTGKYEDALRTVLEEDHPLIAQGRERVISEGSNEVEYRVAGADGRLRWIRATGTAVRGTDGRVERVLGVIMDVSEQRRQAEHNQFLADATAELAKSLDYRKSVAALATAAVPRFSDLAVSVLLRDGHFPPEVAGLAHRHAEGRELMERVQAALSASPGSLGFIGQCIESGTPVFLSSIPEAESEQFAVSPEHIEAVRALNLSAAMCIPLSARGIPLGALVFAQEAPRSFQSSDFPVACELGRRTALAIENALLLEQSFDREAAASRANEALQLIADAGMALNATLEIHETLESLARLVVPRFADICTVSLVRGERLERAALEAATDDLKERVQSLSERSAIPDPELFGAASQAIRNDRPIFLPEVNDALLSRLVDDEAVHRELQEISPHSVIVMPLSARSQTLGVMSFIRVGSRPPFDRDDLSLAGQIARRTAIAADNARLYAEARRANDAKDEFLGMMSHELRTPITVIHGGARVLRSRDEHLDAETRSGLLLDIERESERLSRMLENLLALARAELDREVVLEPVLLQRLLPRLIESLQAGANREIRLSCSGEIPAVSAEPGYIEHIVRNLVVNAIKYSPPATEIEVFVEPGAEGSVVKVLDRGFGVTEEEAGRIFERFYRSDRTSRLASGAGLGLAVCKRLVEAMSGRIWATPREGGGLEVGFSLPLYQEEDIDL